MTDYLICIPFLLLAGFAGWVGRRNWRHRFASGAAMLCALLALLEGLHWCHFSATVWFLISTVFWFIIPMMMLTVQFGIPKYSLTALVILVTGCAVGLSFNSSLLIGRDTTTFGFPVACFQFNTGYSAIAPANDAQVSRASLREFLSQEHRRISKVERYVPMVANAAIWFWCSTFIALSCRRVQFGYLITLAFVHRKRGQEREGDTRTTARIEATISDSIQQSRGAQCYRSPMAHLPVAMG